MKKIILSLLFYCVVLCSFSQVNVLVIGSDSVSKKALKGARIYLKKSGATLFTNEEGMAEFVLPKNLPETVVISAKGYTTDSIVLDQKDRFISLSVLLYSTKLLPGVIVSARAATHSISRLKTLQVEELTAGELRKAACCNLSESFETNASVDVNVTDGISGAKKIQLMGLDGVYTQIQMENIPYLRGLESSFGVNSIPGTWIQSIQITKGAGSVVNGYESMAGLVNLELKKPTKMERLFVNAYLSAFGRAELNVDGATQLTPKWSTGWFAHASGMLGEMDNNHDGFRDVPLGRNLSVMNRWDYRGKNMEAQVGINMYSDKKTGGQLGFSPTVNDGKYGTQLTANHIDLFAKTGFFTRKPYRSLGIIYNVKHQETRVQVGNRTFDGTENRAYVNAIYDDIFGTTIHKIKVGTSLIAVDFKQGIDTTLDNRLEVVPGIFSEYTYTGARFTSVIGARMDYHNLFGTQFSPRLHAKYSLDEYTDIRFTAGKGWRVPNYMIDNISLLASNKKWNAPSEIKPEITWNIGTSLAHEFKLFTRKATVVADIYYTYFRNQLVVDRDADATTVSFINLPGKSFSTSFQLELDVMPLNKLNVHLAYKLLNVQSEYAGKQQEQVMVPQQRGILTISYISRNKRWEYSLTSSIIGRVRLPNETTGETKYSNAYPLVNAQITHVFKRWEAYIGSENSTNFKQNNAIIEPQNPFSPQFDATQIWGPVMGINIYAGMRYTLSKKKE